LTARVRMRDSSVPKGEEGGECTRRYVAKATRFSLGIIRENEFIKENQEFGSLPMM
jgi:hypothetical protein